MRKTTRSDLENVFAVDVKGLKKLLSCGEQTAREIGEKSEARIPKLYLLEFIYPDMNFDPEAG